jgi:hypothetical protein
MMVVLVLLLLVVVQLAGVLVLLMMPAVTLIFVVIVVSRPNCATTPTGFTQATLVLEKVRQVDRETSSCMLNKSARVVWSEWTTPVLLSGFVALDKESPHHDCHLEVVKFGENRVDVRSLFGGTRISECS